MTEKSLTRGQLERKLSQEILNFYRHHLGHRPSKVTCQLFDAKLVIIIEDSITSPEQILLEEGKEDLVKKVRSNLDDAIRPGLKNLIENTAKVKVLDMLSDATLSTGRTGVISILNQAPKVRNSENISSV